MTAARSRLHRTRSNTPRARQRTPVIEYEADRSPALGYEETDQVCWIRCLAHGYPTPLARWHFHEEFELHLITATSGRAFVGDWIGTFHPGHVVLCGSQLPHNWVSDNVPPEGVSERDLVIQFRHEPLLDMARHIPEFHEVLTLVARAARGIEFFQVSELVEDHWHAVRRSQGVRRVMAFLQLLTDLAQCRNHRLLSSAPPSSLDADDPLSRTIQQAVNQITSRIDQPIRLSELAREHAMSESRFSRLFQRVTGQNLTDFVNQLRINTACHLLTQTDHYINDICFQVGFNNLANFNRRFLALKGMTPSEFRRQAARRYRAS